MQKILAKILCSNLKKKLIEIFFNYLKIRKENFLSIKKVVLNLNDSKDLLYAFDQNLKQKLLLKLLKINFFIFQNLSFR